MKLRRISLALLVLSALPMIAVVSGTLWAKTTDNNLSIITSGSMRPLYEPGDAVMVKPVAPEDVKPGLVVMYAAAGDGNPTLHRVVSVRQIGEHSYVQTKGDANPAPDPDFTPLGAVVATPDLSKPGWLGPFVYWSQTQQGRLVTLAPVLVMLMVEQLVWCFRPAGPPARASGRALPRLPRLPRLPVLPRARLSAARVPFAAGAVAAVVLAGSATAVATSALFRDTQHTDRTVQTATLAGPTNLAVTCSRTSLLGLLPSVTVTLRWTRNSTQQITSQDALVTRTSTGAVIGSSPGLSPTTETVQYADFPTDRANYTAQVRSVRTNWTSAYTTVTFTAC